MRDDKNMGVEEEICKALFGDAVDPREFFAKSNPDQSALHVPGALKKPKMSKDRKQRAVTAGLSSVGAAAGVAGLGVARRDIKAAGSFKAAPRSTKVLLPLEVAGLGGELMATKILHHDAVKKPKTSVVKSDFDPIINARRLGVINTEQAIEMIEKSALPKPLAALGHTLKNITSVKGRASIKQEKASKTYASNIIQSGINSVGTPTLRKLGYSGAAGAGVVAGAEGHKVLSSRSKNTPATKRLPALPPVSVDVSAVKVKKSFLTPKAGSIRYVKRTLANNVVQTSNDVASTAANANTASANVSGATEELHRTAKTIRRGVSAAVPVAVTGVGVGGAAGGYAAGKKLRSKVKKDADITWAGEISKVNEEKHQVFGWATVTDIDGVPVLDRQNDMVSLEEIEKAAYEYVITSRKGGDMHTRDGSQPLHTSDLIESFLVTDEKLKELGVDPAAVSKRGWWMGFHIKDEQQWELVKKGGRTGFSIHGKGHRTEREQND